MKHAWLLFFLLFIVSFVALAGSHPEVEVVGGFSKPLTWDNRVSIPYFDQKNKLHWNDEVVTQAGDCSVDWFPGITLMSPHCRRTTIMLNPRVDECQCFGKIEASGVGGGAVAYVGIDESSSESWRRQSSLSRQRPELYLSGATPDGLVFHNFEVWSPLSGKTIKPGWGSFSRPYRTTYLPARKAYLNFKADVSLWSAKGGLYLHAGDRKGELVLPVDKGLLGYFLITSMVPVPGTSLILLGEEYITRGPGSVRFELFDLDERRVLFSEEFSKGHTVSDVRVMAGTDGHVAFSFLDENDGQYHVVHYRIR
jgi:hypothetical protein